MKGNIFDRFNNLAEDHKNNHIIFVCLLSS